MWRGDGKGAEGVAWRHREGRGGWGDARWRGAARWRGVECGPGTAGNEGIGGGMRARGREIGVRE